jgi:hypothetical protein
MSFQDINQSLIKSKLKFLIKKNRQYNLRQEIRRVKAKIWENKRKKKLIKKGKRMKKNEN